MAEGLSDALDRVRAAVLDEATLVRAVGSGRRKRSYPRWRRVELRWVDLKVGRRLQVTVYDERQAHISNHAPGTGAAVAVDDLLAEPFADWQVDTATAELHVQVTPKGGAVIREHVRGEEVVPDHEHDRPKERFLDPADPVLRAVGISDDRGRVKPSRHAKYRQIEEFLRLLDAALDDGLAAGALPPLAPDRPLRVVDLGCGNAYLTFSAYAFLTGVRRLPVVMVGVDRDRAMVERNEALAAELGWDGLGFVAGTIADAEPTSVPDVVLALHACDTATDEALDRGIAWEAPVVLAAPCCHHDIQRQLTTGDTPAPYGLATRHGILGQRLADVLTDAFRAGLLRQHGYRVDVVEFVESRHTPRNTMLRAVRTGAAPSADIQAEYDRLVEEWKVQPALGVMLERRRHDGGVTGGDDQAH